MHPVCGSPSCKNNGLLLYVSKGGEGCASQAVQVTGLLRHVAMGAAGICRSAIPAVCRCVCSIVLSCKTVTRDQN